MEKVRNKTELYMDFIQYMEKEHNVQFNWEPTRFFSQKLEYLDDIDINHEAQFYTIQKIVPKILMSLFYNTENIEQLDLQTIKEFSETDFDIYLNNIQNNHYEPDCDLASNLYLYFENHMTDSGKAQFENYNDFKEKFFSETRINKEIFIDTSTLSDALKNRQILIQVSDITPAEAQSYLKLGQNILESEFASVIKSSNNNNPFKIGHVDNNVDELYGKRNRLEEIKHFIEPLSNGATKMDTGIMRFLMDNAGLSVDKMIDLDRYNEWFKSQNPKTQELIRNFEQELKDSSIQPAPAHLASASLAQMSFIDALTYTVARKIINKDFPTYEELDMSLSEYEEYKDYMLKHHSIQDEQIDPKLRTLGLELKDTTVTIIQPYHRSHQDVKNSDTDFKLKNVTIKVPLDSLYLDEINPNYYIQPQIGYYTIDPNRVSSFDERSQSRYASTDIAKEIKECTIDESHSTANLSKHFGYSEDIKQKIEHDIKKLKDEINDYRVKSEPFPTVSKRKMTM